MSPDGQDFVFRQDSSPSAPPLTHTDTASSGCRWPPTLVITPAHGGGGFQVASTDRLDRVPYLRQ
uniref:DPPIV_N domain-containing protein n=1 Tax=Mesocestoides corti TaxID=53468 RepID=A0A5K3F2X7_MESCO